MQFVRYMMIAATFGLACAALAPSSAMAQNIQPCPANYTPTDSNGNCPGGKPAIGICLNASGGSSNMCAPEMSTILLPGFMLAAAGLARRSRRKAKKD